MAVYKPGEECPLTEIPYGRQEKTRFLQASTLKTSSHRSVIAFGLTGHGKSTFLNFILRRKHFTTSQGLFGTLQSATKETESAHAVVEGQQLMLINTPGFIDPREVNNDGEQSVSEIFQARSLDFRQNMLRAYLDAGEEVGAFILVCSLTARWTAEVTQMMKFLESVSFPWDHCIVVLNHGDHAFPSMPEEEKYTALKEAMANNELPKQLKKLINNSNDRALIVESSKTGDEKYYHSVMKRFLDILDGIPVPYNNPYFLHFARLVEKSCQVAYKAVLQDKQSLDELETKTQDLFQSLQSTGKEVTVAQEEFIGYLEKIADVTNSRILTPEVTVAAVVTGIATTLFGVSFMPITFGMSATAVAGGLAVLAGGIGASTIPPIVKMLQNTSEVKSTQVSYDNAKVIMERLYQLYEEIMQKIGEDSLGHDHPEVHSLLFAHLAGVHMHGVRDKGDKLCLTAENLAVYHRLRKQAKEQSKSGSKSSNCDLLETSPKYALPLGFNLLARGFDVAYTVGTTVEVAQISKESKEVDTQILKTTCIATLEKEMRTIKSLCEAPNQ